MNNEVMESNVMNSEVSTSVVSNDQMKSCLCTHFLVSWRCLADSVLASSPAGRCQVRKDKTWLTYLLCCTVEFIVSVPDLFLDITSGNEFFQMTEDLGQGQW